MSNASSADNFQLILSDNKEHLRAYVVRLASGQFVAWSPYFLRVLRKNARTLRSHLDLADDVVSTLYDPQGERNTSAIFSLANVPNWGLFQLYGGRALAPSLEAAVALAEQGSARLISALKGRFRQSNGGPLEVEEATAYYRHLLACRCTAAMIGQPVRRVAASAAGADGVGQLIAADAQEQLETIVAGLEDVPFALQVTIAPYAAQEINALLQMTARELSRFASLVKGSDSLSISISPGSLLTPIGGTIRQDQRSTGISRVERLSALEEQAHQLEAGRSQGQSDWQRQQQSQEHFNSHTETQYAAGAHITEHSKEHEQAQVHLDRTYAEQYQAHKTYNGVENSVLRDTTQRSSEQQGTRHTDTGEQGSLNAHDSISEATSGNRSGSGNRNETNQYSFGESASFGSSKSWGGSEHEQSSSQFAGSGGEQTSGGYQAADSRSGTGQEQSTYQRAGESNAGGDGVRMETHASQELSARAGAQVGGTVPGLGGAWVSGEQTQVAGQRGQSYEARDHETVQSSGQAGERHQTGETTVSTGARTSDQDYQRNGQESNAQQRSWGGSESISGTEYRSGGGTRTDNVSYGYNEAYSDQHHTDRDSNRTWDSQVAQNVAFQQQSQEASRGVQSMVKSYSGFLDETGTRQGQLTQDDRIATDREISRETDRSESGWRSESQAGDIAKQQTEQGQMSMQQAVMSDAESYARRSSAQLAGETGSFAGSGLTTTRGVMGPGGAGVFAGLSFSRQTMDAQRELATLLFQQQRDRLFAGLNTGFFRVQSVLMAPEPLILERLVGAALSAWREEEVAVPLTARSGDEALWDRAVRFDLDERVEDNPLEPKAYSQGLTSNELAALVHPLRVEGKGGVSATLRPFPSCLGLVRGQGELELGLEISPTTSETTDLVYRLAGRDLMHMLLVGASGSGKSNAAIWIVSQIVNRLREVPETGMPLPVALTGPLHIDVPAGRPALGVTVFDPTGEWRRLASMVLTNEFHFFSLTDPHFCPLGFNPVAIPSPYITPKDWISIFAKQWALNYATGGTGMALVQRSLRLLYEEHGVFQNPAQSANLTLDHLYQKAKELLEELQKSRQDNISPGILKRIVDKLEEFTPGGLHYENFGQPGAPDLERLLWPYGVTVVEGAFKDEMLKGFIVGLLGAATFNHSAGKYEAQIKLHGTLNVRRHLFVFEEAHVVMKSGDKTTEAQAAVEQTAGIWDDIADRGRKYGQILMTAAQHWLGLPEGVVGSAKIVIAQGINTMEDAKAAVAALGIRPGTGAMDEVTQVIDQLLDMPVGVGICKRKRLPKSREDEQKPVACLFPDISSIEPPTDGQLAYMLAHAAQLTQQQRETWELVRSGFTPQGHTLLK